MSEVIVPIEAPAAEEAPKEPTAEKPAEDSTDWKSEARKWEARAKENSAAAKRLSEIDEANKTAEQKAAERIAAAEQRAAELEVKAVRAEVANAKGVPADLLTGSTQEELEASADALIAFRNEQLSTKTPRPDLNQGKPGGVAGTEGDQFAAFFTTQMGG